MIAAAYRSVLRRTVARLLLVSDPSTGSGRLTERAEVDWCVQAIASGENHSPGAMFIVAVNLMFRRRAHVNDYKSDRGA